MFGSKESPRENNDPEFKHKDFKNICVNNAKTSKSSGNDAACNMNVKSLVAECERLSLLAKKAHVSQKDIHQLVSLQSELRDKNTEIAYLQSKVKQQEQ